MGKHTRHIHGVALLVVGGLLATLAWAETTEIVTYYPIPNTNRGELSRLHVDRIITIGPKPDFSLMNPTEPTATDRNSNRYAGTLLMSNQLRIGQNIGNVPFGDGVAIDIVPPETPGAWEPVVFQTRNNDWRLPTVDITAGRVDLGDGNIQSRCFLEFWAQTDNNEQGSGVSIGMSIPTMDNTIGRDLIFAGSSGLDGRWTERMRIVNTGATTGYTKVSGGLNLAPQSIAGDAPPAPAATDVTGMLKYFTSTTDSSTEGLYLYTNGSWNKVALASYPLLGERRFADSSIFSPSLTTTWATVASANQSPPVTLNITDTTTSRGVYLVTWSGRLYMKNEANYWAKIQAVYSSPAIGIQAADQLDDTQSEDPPDWHGYVNVEFSGSALIVLASGRNYSIRLRARVNSNNSTKVDAYLYGGEIKAVLFLPG